MIVSLLIGALLTLALLLLPLAVRRAYRVTRTRATSCPAEFGLPGREVGLDTENGKRIFGWYIHPPREDQPAPALAVMHGWGGSSHQMLPFAPALHAAGFALLLLDARNHGRSDSDSFASMPRFAEDLDHGVNWLRQQAAVDPARVFLLGHSVGAAACLLLASRRHDLAGIVSIAAFAHPAEVMRRQMASLHIPYLPLGWLVLRYVQHTIGHRFDDIAPVNTIRRVSAPVLLIHGDADKLVPFTDAERIHANRGHDRVKLLRLPGAGHNPAGAIARHGGELLAFLNGCRPVSARAIKTRPHEGPDRASNSDFPQA